MIINGRAAVHPGPELPKDLQKKQLILTHRVAQARNQLDAEAIVALPAPDDVYESQDILDPIVDRDAVARHLREHFEHLGRLQDEDTPLGESIPGYAHLPQAKGHLCVIVRDEQRRQKALWVLTLTPERLFGRIDIPTVVPHPETAVSLVS